MGFTKEDRRRRELLGAEQELLGLRAQMSDLLSNYPELDQARRNRHLTNLTAPASAQSSSEAVGPLFDQPPALATPSAAPPSPSTDGFDELALTKGTQAKIEIVMRDEGIGVTVQDIRQTIFKRTGEEFTTKQIAMGLHNMRARHKARRVSPKSHYWVLSASHKEPEPPSEPAKGKPSKPGKSKGA